jgi:hypothetical protein
MILREAIQKAVADFCFIIGTGLLYGGGFALLMMAIVGTFAIDIVLLVLAREYDSFLTGFILGALFCSTGVDPVPLLIASPIMSAIAVSLSFAFGVPYVGVGLLIGWGAAAGLLAIGYGLRELAKIIEPKVDPEDMYTSTTCYSSCSI